MEDTKSRYWEFILYPESMPKDWEEIINHWYMPCVLSPLHDRDIDKDGKIKKAHYHLMVCYGNTTTYNNARKRAEELGSKVVNAISNSKGAYEYWTHKNNPEKAQYKEEDMKFFGGFEKEITLGKTEKEVNEMIQAIVEIINLKNFKELKEIYDYCNNMGLIEYRNLIQNKTLFIKEYTKSRRFIIDETLRQS